MAIMSPQEILTYWSQGISYLEYTALVDRLHAEGKTTSIDSPPSWLEYTHLNLARMKRVQKNYQPTKQTMERFQSIQNPLQWLVITEGWCGDAAQNLPILYHLSTLSTNVSMRCILRDQHPALMDAFLTEGSRSIPVCVVMTPEGIITGRWGPRPAPAQELVMGGKRDSLPYAEVAEKVHQWYAQDKGYTLEKEITERLDGWALVSKR